MDEWNPIKDEVYMKRLSWWQILLADAVAVLALVMGTWAFALLILSLERHA